MDKEEIKQNYHGECICANAACTLKAYFVQEGLAVCGHHSKKAERKALRKNPERKQNLTAAYEAHKDTIREDSALRTGKSMRGSLMCSKMGMVKQQQPTFVPKYMNVFPNFKHTQNKYGGWGMPSLSPKSLGPVEHPQPGLGPAKNLENFHQFSKQTEGEDLATFRNMQRAGFADPEPHRHKNKDKMVCWIWTMPDGTVSEKTYIECRQFYCNYYERLVLETEDFHTLKGALDSGTSLRICGYDGYDPENTDALMGHYTDPSRPFGHELVLYTMLSELPEDQWPWRLMKTEDF